MRVFFYGLFMDQKYLAERGVRFRSAKVAAAEDFELVIGTRASLRKKHGARAYGLIGTMSENEVDRLYAEPSVSDYVSEMVLTSDLTGHREPASCYNLPGEYILGANKRYAAELANLARKLGFPDAYLNEIDQFAV